MKTTHFAYKILILGFALSTNPVFAKSLYNNILRSSTTEDSKAASAAIMANIAADSAPAPAPALPPAGLEIAKETSPFKKIYRSKMEQPADQPVASTQQAVPLANAQAKGAAVYTDASTVFSRPSPTAAAMTVTAPKRSNPIPESPRPADNEEAIPMQAIVAVNAALAAKPMPFSFAKEVTADFSQNQRLVLSPMGSAHRARALAAFVETLSKNPVLIEDQQGLLTEAQTKAPEQSKNLDPAPAG